MIFASVFRDSKNPDIDFEKIKPPFDYATANMDNLRERGLLIVGTPDRVFQDLMEQYHEVGGFGTLLLGSANADEVNVAELAGLRIVQQLSKPA